MEKPGYIVRNAVPADAEAIAKMHMRSWMDTYPNKEAGVSREWAETKTLVRLTAEHIEERRQRIEKASHDNDFLYCVAENETGEIVGFVCPFRNQTIQRVGAIYVAKEYHGSGVAQDLMGRVIDWADPHRPLELNVATYNQRAKAFYHKYGFEEVKGSEQKAYELIPVISMIRKGDQQ